MDATTTPEPALPAASNGHATPPEGAVPITPEVAYEQAGARARIVYERTLKIIEAIKNGVAMARAQGNARGVAANMGLLQDQEVNAGMLREALMLMQLAKPEVVIQTPPPPEPKTMIELP